MFDGNRKFARGILLHPIKDIFVLSFIIKLIHPFFMRLFCFKREPGWDGEWWHKERMLHKKFWDNSVKTFFKSSIPLAIQPLGYYGGVIYHEPVFLKKCEQGHVGLKRSASCAWGMLMSRDRTSSSWILSTWLIAAVILLPHCLSWDLVPESSVSCPLAKFLLPPIGVSCAIVWLILVARPDWHIQTNWRWQM